MPKICYVPKKFTKEHLSIIEKANEILSAFYHAGIEVTVRSLYYQFVKRNIIPNNERSYKRLIGIISEARLAGRIDWNYLQDRARNLVSRESFGDVGDSLTSLSSYYHTDLWKTQKYRPEVWIEKDALSGVIAGVCFENDIPYFCCRGYTSQSEMWRASERLKRYVAGGQRPYIIHMGDHDPSGIDMTRDIRERLGRTFMADFDFERVALTMEQIEETGAPPNPAKISDPRAEDYLAEYGDESWELDALEPDAFRSLIEVQLGKIRDEALWEKAKEAKKADLSVLEDLAENWERYPAQIEELEHEVTEKEATVVSLRRKIVTLEKKLGKGKR